MKGKKNTPIIIAAVVAVILLAVGAYLFLGKNTSNDSSNTGSAMDSGESMTSTFKDLVAMNKSMMCTFSSDEDNKVDGVTYIDSNGRRLAGEYNVTTSNGGYKGYMISDGEYNYIWGTDQKSGIKMKINKEDGENMFSDEDNEGKVIDDNTKANFKCSDWKIDESKFIPPSNIKFIDFSEQMKQVSDKIKEQIPGVDCSICNDLQGTAKEACMKQLSC